MYLMLSGEGPTDIGSTSAGSFKAGPLAWMAERWIERRLDYSLLDSGQVGYISKQKLESTAKKMKPLTKRGKKTPPETRYFYKNARALAVMATQRIRDEGDTDLIAVLFRDSDNRAGSERGLWQDKHQSMLDGFRDGGLATGVPMLAKPISEAWLLCALKNQYQGCAALEYVSASPQSPHSLKKQLQKVLGENTGSDALSDKVKNNEIDISRIDMPSMNAFKNRMDQVLDSLGLPGGQRR